jgi:hypothetical protein
MEDRKSREFEPGGEIANESGKYHNNEYIIFLQNQLTNN